MNVMKGVDSTGKPVNLLLSDDGSLIAAVDNSGDAISLETTAAGVLKVALYGVNGNDYPGLILTHADNQTNSADALVVGGYTYIFNGVQWERERANIEQTILASAARTAQADSADLINRNGRAQLLIVDWTVETDTVTLTPTLQYKDPVSGDYVTFWTAAAPLTDIGTYSYLFQPGGAAGSYTEAVNLRVPRTWRVRMLVGDTDEATYSVAGVDLV